MAPGENWAALRFTWGSELGAEKIEVLMNSDTCSIRNTLKPICTSTWLWVVGAQRKARTFSIQFNWGLFSLLCSVCWLLTIGPSDYLHPFPIVKLDLGLTGANWRANLSTVRSVYNYTFQTSTTRYCFNFVTFEFS